MLEKTKMTLAEVIANVYAVSTLHVFSVLCLLLGTIRQYTVSEWPAVLSLSLAPPRPFGHEVMVTLINNTQLRSLAGIPANILMCSECLLN